MLELIWHIMLLPITLKASSFLGLLLSPNFSSERSNQICFLGTPCTCPIQFSLWIHWLRWCKWQMLISINVWFMEGQYPERAFLPGPPQCPAGVRMEYRLRDCRVSIRNPFTVWKIPHLYYLRPCKFSLSYQSASSENGSRRVYPPCLWIITYLGQAWYHTSYTSIENHLLSLVERT